MSCPAPDRVLDYLARRLDARERDEIDAHVDECSACRELFADLARSVDDDIPIARAEDPTTIGRYELRSRLGDGGMGTVYEAWDPQLARKLAVKLLHPEHQLDRMVREGRALAKLAHPNVVAVYDAGSEGDRAYIAMEYVEGTTLAAWLRESHAVKEILERFVAIGRGLAAAHRAGIIHRDVKPENVLIDREGRVKVADFGLAYEQDADRMTRPGIVVGTPSYMAPEQRRGEPATAASDQYSLCATLERALGDRAPGWVSKAILRGRAADPADRFASIDDLVAAIDPARRKRRHRLVAGLAVAIVAIASTGVVLVARGHDRFAAACELARAATPHPRIDGAQLDRAITAYDDQLVRSGTKLCAARPEDATAREAFALATTCLAERRSAFASAIAAPGLAVARIHGLPSVDDCENPLPLVEERDARATPAGLIRRELLATELAAAPAARAAGDFKAGALRARTAILLARPFGGALLAKALLTYAQVASPVDGFPPVDAAMREAIALAEAAHADALRASALVYHMAALAREAGHEREALTLQPIAEAAVARANMTNTLGPMLGVSIGAAQMRLGEPEKALATLERTLKLAREVFPPDDARLPEYIYPVGIALGELRRETEAATYHAEAYTIASKVWGPDHPNAVRYEINLAAKYGSVYNCEPALAAARHARKALTGVLAPTSVEHLVLDRIMGFCLYKQEDYPAALAENLERERALHEAGADHTTDMADAWIDIGSVELELHRPQDAIAHYARAVALLEEIVGVTDIRLGEPLARQGDAEETIGHTAHAIALLERALVIETNANAAPLSLADVEHPLARALWTRNPARARQLAAKARAAFVAGGKPYESWVERISEWQRTHP